MIPLVLVPGLGSNGRVWERTVAALGDAAACTVGDTLTDDSLAGMAERILAAAPPRFALAGVSMGGMVSLEIVARAPERVMRLALFDTNARPDTPEQGARRRATNAAVVNASDWPGLARHSRGTLVHRDADAETHALLDRMSEEVGPATYVRQNEAAAARRDQWPILPTIAVPTLVVVGADDVMTPPALAEAIAAAIPRATLHVVPDCGHLPPLELPAVVAALLRPWLADADA